MLITEHNYLVHLRVIISPYKLVNCILVFIQKFLVVLVSVGQSHKLTTSELVMEIPFKTNKLRTRT